MNKPSPEEERLLQEFLSCKNEAERQAWIQWNRDLFRPDAERTAQAVFHSGGLLGSNRSEAEDYCDKRNAVTLEKTMGGRVLEQARLYETVGEQQAHRLFVQASETFVQSARDKVQTFTFIAREKSVFQTNELPLLLSNKDVTHINEVPRRDLVKMWHNDQTSEKLEARREINYHLHQSVKLISYDAVETARQKKESHVETHSQRLEVTNDQGLKRYIEVTDIKQGETLKGLVLSEEHSRRIDALKQDESLRISATEIKESIAREHKEELKRQSQQENTERPQQSAQTQTPPAQNQTQQQRR